MMSSAIFLFCAALGQVNNDAAPPEPPAESSPPPVTASLADNGETAFVASLYQPAPSATPGLSTNNPAAANQPSPRRPQGNPYARLARVPNMFGDSLSPPLTAFIQSCDSNFPSAVVTEVITGGGRYIPIGENNKPLPMDRVYFMYNGFFNAATTTDVTTGNQFDSNLQRYTLGYEKTFFDENVSLEIRLPLSTSFDIDIPNYSSSTGTMGNLTLVYKQLLKKTESFSLAAGLGLGLPTGDSFSGTSGLTNFELENESVYFIPYIGLMKNITDDWFTTAYAQIEIAGSGDTFRVGNNVLGKLNAANYARFDVALGRWIVRDLGRSYLDGIALVSEFHYITAVNDADLVDSSGLVNSCTFSLGGIGNRSDYLNTSAGVHFQLTELTNLRVSGVFPMRADPDRQFDGELQVSFNRHF
jgi:hypothetical protein